MSLPSQRKYDLQVQKNIEKYSKELRKLYIEVIKEVSLLTQNGNFNTTNGFFFKDYSRLNKKVNELIKQLNSDVYGLTVNGIDESWQIGVEKHNTLFEYVFGKTAKELPKEYLNRYLSVNLKAKNAFISRKQNGLNLSQRVWKNSSQFKQELELALEYALQKGQSAKTTANQITRYLNNPDGLYTRLKDNSGLQRLNKAAKAYSPGQGVYRSSYKNALRVTRNETNFAYEASNRNKRDQQDFIVGVKIKTWSGHTASDDKGGISCLSLEGNYPKNFNFDQKWHVNCLCQSFSILKSREELDNDTALILAGKEPSTKSANKVNSIPNKKYMKDVKEFTKNWKTKPQWLTDI